MNEELKKLSRQLEGELYLDNATRILYATDASAFQEKPLAVAVPKSIDDLKKIDCICFN